jgi:hypothetical protein
MSYNEEIHKRYSVLRIITYGMLVGAPLCYSLLVYLLIQEHQVPARPNPGLLYGFLALAAIIFVIPAGIDKFKFVLKASYKRKEPRARNAQIAFSIMITKLAFVESPYVIGLAVFFITGITSGLLYFAAIGILASFAYWPTESRFNQLVQDLEGQ